MSDTSQSEWTDQDERIALIAEKLDAVDAKLEKLSSEVRMVGIAVLIVAAMVFFDWPQ